MFLNFLPIEPYLKIFLWVEKDIIFLNIFLKRANIVHSHRRRTAKICFENKIVWLQMLIKWLKINFFYFFFIFRFPTYSSWQLSKKNWKILVLSTFFLRRNIKKLYFWCRLYFWRMSTIPRWNLNTSDRNSLKKVPHNLI